MNPFLSTTKGVPNPYTTALPSKSTANPYTTTTVQQSQPTTIQGPIAPTPVPTKPLYTNGITSDPAEMAKNRAELASSISNLKPINPIGINLASTNNTINSNLINTGSTRADVNNIVSQKQSEFANGINQNLQPTTGYQKFLKDYSSAVQFSPEQKLAYEGQQSTASAISDIQRGLQNRRAELSRNGALSPAQVAADMRQYETDANSRIADLQSANRDFTLTFNSLENARKNTLDAFQIQSPFYKPTEVSPGSQIIDPSTGQVINQGTGVAPSTAISYANQLYQNDLISGQPKLTADGQVDSNYYFNQAQQQLSGGRGSLGAISTPSLNGGFNQQVPASIQSATSYIDNQAYIDSGNLNTNQLPIAQAYSARTGTPLLTEKDATKLKEANATFNSADSLLGVITDLSKKLITAKSAAGIPLQYVSTTLGSLFKTNPDAVVFDSSIKAFSSLLTRAAGEKGTLTDQDVTRIINALPTKADTLDTAAEKSDTLVKLYESVKKSSIDTYLGSKKPQGGQMVQTNNSQFTGDVWK